MNKFLLSLLTCFLLAAAPTANAFYSFSGMLSTPVGVQATGIWAYNFRISWEIAQQADNSWFYKYLLSENDGSALDPGAVSHWIVEVSPGVTDNDFWGFNGGSVELGSWAEADLIVNGLKLDYGEVGQLEWSFFCSRGPTWGDFFAKDGQAGGQGLNTAWNTGYQDADPIAAPADGSIGNKILRPDTATSVVPEPTTLSLLGLGLIGLRLFRRRG